MTRTRRWKLQYGLALAVLGAIAIAAIVALRGQTLAVVGVALLLLIPGRLHGMLWRELYRGRRLQARGELAAAIGEYERFLARTDRAPWLAGMWWLAWAVYTRDGRAMAENNLGGCHLDRGDVDQARDALQRALTIDPEYPIPHINLTRVALLEGDRDAAERHAQRAVELGFDGSTVDQLLTTASATLAEVEGRGRS